MLDKNNLGFVNFVGNRQYITLGNLAEIANAQRLLAAVGVVIYLS